MNSANTLNLQLALNRVRSSDVGDGSTRSIGTIDNASSLVGQSIWSKAAWTRVLGSRSVNEALVSWSQDHRNLTPNSIAPEININGFGILGGDSLGQHLYTSEQLQLSDNVSISRGSTLFTLGGTFAYDPAHEQREANLNGTLRLQLADRLSRLPPSPLSADLRHRQHSLQRIGSRTRALRQREDHRSPTIDSDGRPSLGWPVESRSRPTPTPQSPRRNPSRTISTQWQPRLGLAWNTDSEDYRSHFRRPLLRTNSRNLLPPSLRRQRAPNRRRRYLLRPAGHRTDRRTHRNACTASSAPPSGLTTPDALDRRNRRELSQPNCRSRLPLDVERDITAKLNLAAGYVHSSTWHLQRADRPEPQLHQRPTASESPYFRSTRPNPAIGRLHG